MYHIFFIHSLTVRYSDWFHYLSVINSAMANMGIQVSLLWADLDSLMCIPMRSIAGSHGNLRCRCWRDLHTDLHSHQHSRQNKFFFFHKPCPVLSCLFPERQSFYSFWAVVFLLRKSHPVSLFSFCILKALYLALKAFSMLSYYFSWVKVSLRRLFSSSPVGPRWTKLLSLLTPLAKCWESRHLP